MLYTLIGIVVALVFAWVLYWDGVRCGWWGWKPVERYVQAYSEETRGSIRQIIADMLERLPFYSLHGVITKCVPVVLRDLSTVDELRLKLLAVEYAARQAGRLTYLFKKPLVEEAIRLYKLGVEYAVMRCAPIYHEEVRCKRRDGGGSTAADSNLEHYVVRVVDQGESLILIENIPAYQHLRHKARGKLRLLTRFDIQSAIHHFEEGVEYDVVSRQGKSHAEQVKDGSAEQYKRRVLNVCDEPPGVRIVPKEAIKPAR